MPSGITLLRSSFFLVLIGGFWACKPAELQPEDALRRFLADIEYGRAEAVWAALTDANQAELLQRHAALAKATGKPVSGNKTEILYTELGLEPLGSAENIVVVSPPSAEVTLRVAVKDGRSAEVKLQRVGEGWRIDLLSALKKAPPLDEGLKGPPPPPPPIE